MKNKRLSNEYVYSLLFKFISVIISFLYSVLLTRFLGAGYKGTFTFIASVVSVLAEIITVGIQQAYPFFRKKYGKDTIAAPYLSFVYAWFVLWAIGAAAVFFASKGYAGPDVRFSVLFSPLIAFSNTVGYIFLIENPNAKNRVDLFVLFIQLALIGVLLWGSSPDYTRILCVFALPHVLNAVIFSFKLHPSLSFRAFDFAMVGRILRFGFFPMLALLLTTLNYKIDVIMLKQFPNISIEDVGVYSLGISVAEKIIMVPETLKGILASHLSKGADHKETARICRLSFVSSLVFCFLILCFGRFLIDLIYGKEFSGAYDVVVISAAGAVFIGFFKLLAQYNIIHKKQIRNTLMLAASILVNCVLNVILIPSWGINGAALATCIGHLVCGILFIISFSVISQSPVQSLFIPQKDDFRAIKRWLFGKKEE